VNPKIKKPGETADPDAAASEPRTWTYVRWGEGQKTGTTIAMGIGDEDMAYMDRELQAIEQKKPDAKVTIVRRPSDDPLQNVVVYDTILGAPPGSTAHGIDTGALTTGIGIAPSTALEQLLSQLDRRFPFRGKGPLDGVGDDGVLRVTDDPGRNGALRTGPDHGALKRAVLDDRRTLRTETLSDSTQTRYLAIVARPSMVADARMWDLSALDAAGNGEASGPQDPFDPFRDLLRAP
jgi:hypothetical protein